MGRMHPVPVIQRLTKEYMFEAGQQRKSRAVIAQELNCALKTLHNYLSENKELLEVYQKGYQDGHLEWQETAKERVLSKFLELVEAGNPACVLFGMKALHGYKDDSTIIHQGTVEHVHSKFHTPEQIQAMADRVKLLAQDKEIMDAQIVEEKKE